MRILKKLVIKLITMALMVAALGAVLRFARPRLMKAAGLPEGVPGTADISPVHFSSDESDLMATVFKSAIRMLTGSASRKELAGELSTKLYSGRADPATMHELGIELVQPGGDASNPATLAAGGPANNNAKVASVSAAAVTSKSASKTAIAPGGKSLKLPAQTPAQNALVAQIYRRAMANPELSLVPVVLVGMVGVRGFKRRRTPADDLLMPDMSTLLPSESEAYEMKHAVHALKAEDFEMLVALIYSRQGYRVSMYSALSGGKGGDFLMQRKSERVLVQCKNICQDHKVPIERIRELHDALPAASATKGMYVSSCGFSWDARNFAKAKGMTVINARTLDALITDAKKTPDEDLLAVSRWAPEFMAKVKTIDSTCPACEAGMDQLAVSSGLVWVCSQRPDCRGRRIARKYQKAGGVVSDAPRTSSKAIAIS